MIYIVFVCALTKKKRKEAKMSGYTQKFSLKYSLLNQRPNKPQWLEAQIFPSPKLPHLSIQPKRQVPIIRPNLHFSHSFPILPKPLAAAGGHRRRGDRLARHSGEEEAWALRHAGKATGDHGSSMGTGEEDDDR